MADELELEGFSIVYIDIWQRSSGHFNTNVLYKRRNGEGWYHKETSTDPNFEPDEYEVSDVAAREIMHGPGYEDELVDLRAKYGLCWYPTYEQELAELRARHGLPPRPKTRKARAA